MWKRLISASLTFGLAAAAPPALAQTICGQYERLRDALADDYGESVVDHHGSCLVFGRVCLVTEPYNHEREKFLQAMKLIADVVGVGIPIVCGNPAHASEYSNRPGHLLRGLIIPPPGVK